VESRARYGIARDPQGDAIAKHTEYGAATTLSRKGVIRKATVDRRTRPSDKDEIKAMALIGPDSPLSHLPANLNPRQRLFFDAIRYSIAMLDVAYLSLHRLLVQASELQIQASDDEDGVDLRLFLPRVFLDAFSVVDMANRLWTLLNNMAGIKRTPDMRVCLSKMRKAEDLRNPVQHLSGELVDLAGQDEATWGWLLWIYATNQTTEFHVFMALPGSLGETKITPPTSGPEGLFRTPVDQIELSAYGHRLSLTMLWDAVAEFVPAFEHTLSQAFQGRPTSVTDLLLRVVGHTERPPEILWREGSKEDPSASVE
jgi:hypothetical protein